MRSFTKVELRVGSPRAIKPLVDTQNKEMPTLGVMSLNLKTVANDKHQQEVVMCSLLYQQGVNTDGPTTVPVQFTFCAVRKLNNGATYCDPMALILCINCMCAAPLPLDLNDQLNKQKDARLTVCPSERALLLALLSMPAPPGSFFAVVIMSQIKSPCATPTCW